MKRIAVAALLAAWPAWAEDAPATRPTRDVDVVYRTNAGGKVVEQRWRYRAADQRLRLDTPSPGLYLIVDRRARTMQMVSDGDRGVLDLRYDPAHVPGRSVSPGHGFVRLGGEVIAGVPCTEWQTADSAGRPTIACLTADGVLLRARTGATVLVQAARVTYGPLDAAAFVPPASYRHSAAREAK